MKLYLDTADSKQIERHLATGLFSGVTCNPAILKAAGLTPDTARTLYDRVIGAGGQELYLQTFGSGAQAQIDQAMRYRDLGEEVVVKVVCSRAGATICAQLEQQGVRVLLTAVHDAKQAITAIAAGASFVTPYLSEMFKTGRDGTDQVLTMLRILRSKPTRTKLFMAGLSDIASTIRMAEEGVEYLTMTPSLADALFEQPETDAMAEYFEGVSTG